MTETDRSDADRRTLLERIATLEARLRSLEVGHAHGQSGEGHEADALMVQVREGLRARARPGADLPYRLLVEEMADGALIVSTGGIVLFQNANARALFGRALTGTRFVDAFPGEDRKRLAAELFDAHGTEETCLPGRDGAPVRVRLSSRRMLLDGVGRHAVLVSDLTEHDRLVALEAANAAKSHFLGLLGHEIRNPLGSLSAALELLESDERSGAAEHIRKLMARQVRQIGALVDDLLDTTRIDQGKLNVVSEAVDLGELLGSCHESVLMRTLETNVTILHPPPDEAIWVEADPVRLRQVIENLLRNAIEASDVGGEVRLETRRDAREVSVEIIDSGRGIAAENLDRILEPFEQVHDVGRKPRGLGLGLALARSLVQALGGRLEVTSDGPGRGATFRVTLPLCDAPAASSSRPETAPGASARSLQILLVDDHADTLGVLRVLLERAGHKVGTAMSAAEARRSIAAAAPELVLTDIDLPDESGLSLARSVLRGSDFEGVFVALTGHADATMKGQLDEAGFSGYFAKPVKIRALLGYLEEIASRERPALPIR